MFLEVVYRDKSYTHFICLNWIMTTLLLFCKVYWNFSWGCPSNLSDLSRYGSGIASVICKNSVGKFAFMWCFSTALNKKLRKF